MRIISLSFDRQLQCPDGPGQFLDSVNVNAGYEIEADESFYYVRHPVRWAKLFMRVHASKCGAAICEAEPPPPATPAAAKK